MGRRESEFREFFEAEYARLYRLAVLLAGNSIEAEDLAQEAMLRTYRAWSRIGSRELVHAPISPAWDGPGQETLESWGLRPPPSGTPTGPPPQRKTLPPYDSSG